MPEISRFLGILSAMYDNDHAVKTERSSKIYGSGHTEEVARALSNSPCVLLADEPTAALDSRRGRQVMEPFRQVAHEQGTPVVVVTHDRRALDVFDTIHEMEDGMVERMVGS